VNFWKFCYLKIFHNVVLSILDVKLDFPQGNVFVMSLIQGTSQIMCSNYIYNIMSVKLYETANLIIHLFCCTVCLLISNRSSGWAQVSNISSLFNGCYASGWTADRPCSSKFWLSTKHSNRTVTTLTICIQ